MRIKICQIKWWIQCIRITVGETKATKARERREDTTRTAGSTRGFQGLSWKNPVNLVGLSEHTVTDRVRIIPCILSLHGNISCKIGMWGLSELIKTLDFKRVKISEHARKRWTAIGCEKRLRYYDDVGGVSIINCISWMKLELILRWSFLWCNSHYQIFHCQFGRRVGSVWPVRYWRYVEGERVNLISCLNIHGVVSFCIRWETTSTDKFNKYIMEQVIL